MIVLTKRIILKIKWDIISNVFRNNHYVFFIFMVITSLKVLARLIKGIRVLEFIKEKKKKKVSFWGVRSQKEEILKLKAL